MTGTFLILGGVALAVGVVLGVLVRLRLERRSPVSGSEPDLGLLEMVAMRPSRREAESTARWLSAENVRTTIARTPDGWGVLVFPDQAADARVLLHAG